jgi:hypothetical protein
MGECQMTCSGDKKDCYVKQVITQRNRAEEAYLNMQEMVIEMEAKMEKMTLDISKMARERAYEIAKQIDKLTLANIPTKTLEKLVKMAKKELERRTY